MQSPTGSGKMASEFELKSSTVGAGRSRPPLSGQREVDQANYINNASAGSAFGDAVSF